MNNHLMFTKKQILPNKNEKSQINKNTLKQIIKENIKEHIYSSRTDETNNSSKIVSWPLICVFSLMCFSWCVFMFVQTLDEKYGTT